MNSENFISIEKMSAHYQLEVSFFSNLKEIDLLEIILIEEVPHIHVDSLSDLEKMIRLHNELELNFEGIDVVWNLLQRITDLETELQTVKNRLKLYE